MPDARTFVIVGGGLAAAKAAEALRAEGFAGRVVVVAAEPVPPYERPPLSKGYLAGDSGFEDAVVHDAGFYADHAIELVTAEAVALAPGEHRLQLADGRALGYDRLLLATGAAPRRVPIPGVHAQGVHVLRTVADADALRSVIGPQRRLAIVGAGWIGCEVAATARKLGAHVTLVERAGTPLEGVLGPELGRFYGDVHRERGVELIAPARVTAIEPGMRVVLAGGRVVPCDAVLLASGVAPATALAHAAGLQLDDGIAVDELLRTSAPDVFAAGDVAAAAHPRYGRRIRVEHWDTAREQGAAAARSMLGRGESYRRLPYFFSDQYDLGLEYVGRHGAAHRLVVRGTLDSAPFQAFWVAPDGSVGAGMHVNDWEAIQPIRRLVEEGARVDAARLSDPDLPLELAATGASRAHDG